MRWKKSFRLFGAVAFVLLIFIAVFWQGNARKRNIIENPLEMAEKATAKPIPKTNIPLILHQLSKSSKLNAYDYHRYHSFDSHNPSLLHLLWTDDDISAFVKKYYPNEYDLFMNLPHPILRTDLARYMLVNTFGGIYSDFDTSSLKPIDKWLSKTNATNVHMIVGIERDNSDIREKLPGYVSVVGLCQWTFAASRHHSLLKNLINESFHYIKTDKFKELSFNARVIELTGPGIFTSEVFKYINKFNHNVKELEELEHPKVIQDLIVLPITAFNVGTKAGKKDGKPITGTFFILMLDPDACVHHAFHGSWKKDNAELNLPENA
jgi:alpha 1,6-mannosyltransferase